MISKVDNSALVEAKEWLHKYVDNEATTAEVIEALYEGGFPEGPVREVCFALVGKGACITVEWGVEILEHPERVNWGGSVPKFWVGAVPTFTCLDLRQARARSRFISAQALHVLFRDELVGEPFPFGHQPLPVKSMIFGSKSAFATLRELHKQYNNAQQVTIFSCSYTPPAWTFYGDDGEEYFGLELELEFSVGAGIKETALGKLPLSDYPEVYYVQEGSIHNGVEIVTHPGSFKYWTQEFDWEIHLSDLIDAGFRARSTCGLHIHVSRSALTEEQWMKVGYFVHTHPELIEELGRRKSNNFSKFKKDKSLVSCNFSEERYEAINFTNKHTVELRFFASTTKWAELRDALCVVKALVWLGRVCDTETVLSKSKSAESFQCLLNDTRMVESATVCLEDSEVVSLAHPQ